MTHEKTSLGQPRSDLNVLHERVCFKYNLSLGVALLLISAIDTGFGIGSFQRAASAARLTGFEIVGLITLLPFLLVLAIAVKCLTERLVYILFFLNAAFELAVRVTSHSAKSSVFVLHYYAVSLAIGIYTTVAIIVALVVARATLPR